MNIEQVDLQEPPHLQDYKKIIQNTANAGIPKKEFLKLRNPLVLLNEIFRGAR